MEIYCTTLSKKSMKQLIEKLYGRIGFRTAWKVAGIVYGEKVLS